MLCLSGFELYSRWVPLISSALKARGCLFKNHPLTKNLFLSFFFTTFKHPFTQKTE